MQKRSLLKLFPFFAWLHTCTPATLKKDLLAGLSVGLVLIPQSMANAQLAGLPPHYGLYASLFPTIIAGLLSSSQYMCTGMVAIVAMMTAAALEPIAISGSPGYISYAVLLSFMVGGLQILLRLFRLSFLVNFLSQPVISGFTNAAVILIALSQLNKIFGISGEPGNTYFETLYRSVIAIPSQMHLPTMLMAFLTIFLLYIVPRLNKNLPSVLIAVIITTIISWSMGYENNLTVRLEQVKSEKATALLQNITSKSLELKAMLTERTGIYNILQQLNYAEQQQRLAIQHKLDQLDIEIKLLRMEMRLSRSELKHMKFVAAPATETPSQQNLIFEKGSAEFAKRFPAGHKQGVWHISLSADLHPKGNITFSSGGAVVGTIPQGLPSILLPDADANIMLQLFPFAVAIAFIAIANSISVAKITSRTAGKHIENKQEIFALGVANIVSGLSQSGPVAGSFSSSAVNARSGAKTGLSAVFAGLTTLMTLLFITPLLYYLPQSVLAAIVIYAMFNQIHLSAFMHESKSQWSDGFIGVTTFIVTLLTAPRLDIGLSIGLILSLIVFIYRSMHPGIRTLSYGSEDRVCDSSLVNDKPCPYITVLRFQQALFFVNSNTLEEHIIELIETNPKIRHIHLVCTGINDIDASGEDALRMLVRWLKQAGVGLTLNGLNENLDAILDRTGLLDSIGRENIFHTMQEGICVAHRRINEKYGQHDCPWSRFCD